MLNKVLRKYGLCITSGVMAAEFLALSITVGPSNHGTAVVLCNSISIHGSRQYAFNCSVMAFFLHTHALFLTTPPLQNESYEEWQKTGGCSKTKHQGYILNCLGHAALSTAKLLGDCCVFTNMAGEVMQRIMLANWIMWGQCINGMNGI